MKLLRLVPVGSILLAFCLPLSGLAQRTTPPPAPTTPTRQIPDPLKPWQDWATWNDPHRDCPTPYHDAKQHLCFWPSKLALMAEKAGGKFSLGVTVYHETWVPLPGGAGAGGS